jgi:hypothetical protein
MPSQILKCAKIEKAKASRNCTGLVPSRAFRGFPLSAYLADITLLIGAGQRLGDFGLFRALLKKDPVEITLEETS